MLRRKHDEDHVNQRVPFQAAPDGITQPSIDLDAVDVEVNTAVKSSFACLSSQEHQELGSCLFLFPVSSCISPSLGTVLTFSPGRNYSRTHTH